MQEKQAIRYIGGGGYGESKELTELQQGAPMAAAARPQSTGASPNPQSTGSAPPAPPNLVPFNAPTQYEDEPLSNGAPWGAGLNAPPLQAPEGLDDTDRQRALFLLGMLEKAAEQPNASRATRQLVRRLRSEL